MDNSKESIADAQELLDSAKEWVLKEGNCYYCNKPVNNLSANPSQWGIPLCHADEPGKVKAHHIGCVSERLACVPVLRAEIERIKKQYQADLEHQQATDWTRFRKIGAEEAKRLLEEKLKDNLIVNVWKRYQEPEHKNNFVDKHRDMEKAIEVYMEQRKNNGQN